MSKKKPYLIDVPVLITIFVRPEKLILLFNEIKKARPSKLFIICDGPRKNFPDDLKLINESKKIMEDIDWECKVYKKYSNINQGMYVTVASGLKWAFTFVDRLIFLEDDITPNQSFFRFCETLLIKYKDDKRVSMICGMNHLGEYNKPDADYFFSNTGSIWGFAIWRRFYEDFNLDIIFSEDEYHLDLLLKSYPRVRRKQLRKNIIQSRKDWKNNNTKGAFELVSGAARFLNSGLLIIPKKNMISCKGISENSGHSTNHPLKLPKSIRNLFNMKTYDIDFPIKHPNYIIADKHYEKEVLKIMGANELITIYRKFETRLRLLFFKIILKK